MLRFIIFCCIWFLIHDEINGLENSTALLAYSFMSLASLSPSALIRISVLKDNKVCLPCGNSASSSLIWTHLNRNVLVTRQGSNQTNKDCQRYRLKEDGGLCMLKLDHSDSGEYQCNQRLVVELQVLTGYEFIVSAGWTLLLPCRRSSKPKHKWLRQKEGQKEQVIFIHFKNGTGKAGIDGNRLSYMNNALQITDLQPEDAGIYFCNKQMQAKLTVLEEPPETTRVSSSTTTTTVSAITEVFDEKRKPKNALLRVAVIGLGLMILLIVLVCVVLTCMKCRKKRRHRYAAKRREVTELELWMTYNGQTEYEVFERPTIPDDTVHYASLGRQSWSQRPSWSPPNFGSNNVVYSSVITPPAAKNTFR